MRKTLARLLVAVSAVFVLHAQSGTPAGNAQKGRQLFQSYGCYQCHGREAQGGAGTGPRLAPKPIPFTQLSKYVRHPTGQMPPYTERVVSNEDLADIYAFLSAQPTPPAAKNIPLLNN